MDFNTKLTAPFADESFGVNRMSYALNSPLLETMLRYIALKKCDTSGIENIKRLKVFRSSYTSTSDAKDLVASAEGTGSNISVFTSIRSADPLILEMEGYVSLDKPPYSITPYLSSWGSATTAYVNEEKQHLVLFVKRAVSEWIERLASSIFRGLTWLYKGDPILDEDETKIFRAIANKDWTTAEVELNKFCDTFDFEDIIRKKTLIGWCDCGREAMIEKLKNGIKDLHEYIATKERDIANKKVELANKKENLAAYNTKKESDKDALYNFFKSRKALSIWKVENNGSQGKDLLFSIIETLEFFDTDEFNRCYDNEDSYFYEGCSTDEKRRLCVALFRDMKAKIRTESTFRLQNTSALTPENIRCGNNDRIAIGHPHLIGYRCLGGNETYIESYLDAGDWDLAIDQAIQATKNLNFGDVVVMEKFLGWLNEDVMTNVRCIILPDGTEMTPREFLEKLDEEEKAKETSETHE